MFILLLVFIVSVLCINLMYLIHINNNNKQQSCTSSSSSRKDTPSNSLEPTIPRAPTPPPPVVLVQEKCPPSTIVVKTSLPPQITNTNNTTNIKKKYLVAIMTVCEARTARRSMRQWLRNPLSPKSVSELFDYKFFVETERYVNDQVTEPMKCLVELHNEQEQYGDLVFLDLKKDDQGWFKLSHKVERMIQYVNEHYLDQYQYIAKADDDTLLLVDALDEVIREKEKEFLQYSKEWGYQEYQGKTKQDETKFLLKHLPLYAGFRYNNNWVILEGNWQNVPYHYDSGLQQYTKYMSGGMYVLSNSIIHALGSSSRIVPLAKWTMEDANVGFWITSLKAVWLHIPNIVTHDGANCYEGKMVVYHPLKNPDIMRDAYDCVLKEQWNELCGLTMAVNNDRGFHDTVRT
jgi:hypothetical protein